MHDDTRMDFYEEKHILWQPLNGVCTTTTTTQRQQHSPTATPPHTMNTEHFASRRKSSAISHPVSPKYCSMPLTSPSVSLGGSILNIIYIVSMAYEMHALCCVSQV